MSNRVRGSRVQSLSQGTGSTEDYFFNKSNSKYGFSIGKNAQALIDIAERFDSSSEIVDIQDQIQEMTIAVRRKSAEYLALEGLALYSDDENIVELRRQLFAVTQMIYGDLIHNEVEAMVDSGDDVEYDACAPSQTDRHSNRSIVGWVCNHLYRFRKNTKSRKKLLKKLGG